jgi:hypothetical protein
MPAPRTAAFIDVGDAGTRRPIPDDTASNDIAATHSVVEVASLDATARALAQLGTPLSDDDLMTLRGDITAALITGPDGHRFLVEERRAMPQQPQNALGLTSRVLRAQGKPGRTRPVS